MKKLSHVTEEGRANMVDVGGKETQLRIASAEGFISLAPDTVALIRENKMKKGDVLTIAEIAGIQGGKKTSELVPLCHPLQITKIDVKATLKDDGVLIESEARCVGQTGIEMEAITAVSIGLITIYDMCKAVDKKMIIRDIRLTGKQKI